MGHCEGHGIRLDLIKFNYYPSILLISSFMQVFNNVDL